MEFSSTFSIRANKFLLANLPTRLRSTNQRGTVITEIPIGTAGITKIPLMYCPFYLLSAEGKLSNNVLIKVEELPKDNCSYTVSSFDPFLKICSDSYSLIKCKIKDKMYYGCRGGIFDADLKPLIVAYYNVSWKENLSPDLELFNVNSIDLYVAKKVFLDDKDIVCKNIAKKLIPYYIQRETTTLGYHYKFRASAQTPINIIIQDGDIQYTRWNKGKINDFSSKIASETLIDFKDYLFDAMKVYYGVLR